MTILVSSRLLRLVRTMTILMMFASCSPMQPAAGDLEIRTVKDSYEILLSGSTFRQTFQVEITNQESGTIHFAACGNDRLIVSLWVLQESVWEFVDGVNCFPETGINVENGESKSVRIELASSRQFDERTNSMRGIGGDEDFSGVYRLEFRASRGLKDNTATDESAPLDWATSNSFSLIDLRQQ